MPIPIRDQWKEFYNNMSHEEWNDNYLKALQNTPTACWSTPMGPPPGLLIADRSPMPELKKSDLTLWERYIYWKAFRKARRNFIYSQIQNKQELRAERKNAVRRAGANAFNKWKEYADRVPPKK